MEGHELVRQSGAAIANAAELLTVAQAVLESGFHEDTIRRHIKKGCLLVVRRGPFRRIRIRRQDFDSYLTHPPNASA